MKILFSTGIFLFISLVSSSLPAKGVFLKNVLLKTESNFKKVKVTVLSHNNPVIINGKSFLFNSNKNTVKAQKENEVTEKLFYIIAGKKYTREKLLSYARAQKNLLKSYRGSACKDVDSLIALLKGCSKIKEKHVALHANFYWVDIRDRDLQRVANCFPNNNQRYVKNLIRNKFRKLHM